MDHASKVKIQQLCSSANYKQNVSLSLRLIESLQCRIGYYFRAWVLYYSFGTCKDAYTSIMQLCSSSVYKRNL